MANHFSLPFKYNKVIIESKSTMIPSECPQHSEEDIANCVFAICASELEQYLYEPEFGIPDLTFEQEPINLKPIENAILRWEPRAKVLAEVNNERLQEAISEANLLTQLA